MFDVKNSIIHMTSENKNLQFDQFKAALDEAILRHVLIKRWYVRANQTPFVNKDIMKRSYLRNKLTLIEKHIISNV